MVAKKLPSEVPTFYWDNRSDPNEVFRTLEGYLRDFQTRLIVLAEDHADLIDRGQLLSYTVASLPTATVAARMIYVSDETGGAVPAFSDGSNWRRVTDRVVIS